MGVGVYACLSAIVLCHLGGRLGVASFVSLNQAHANKVCTWFKGIKEKGMRDIICIGMGARLLVLTSTAITSAAPCHVCLIICVCMCVCVCG